MTKKKLDLAIDRANAGTALDIAEAYYDQCVVGDMPWSQFATEQIADRAILRYDKHIRAALSRAGVVLEEGEVLDQAVLRRVIEDKTGLQLDSLSPETVQAAIKDRISAKITDALGVEVSGITSGDQLKAAVLDAARRSVVSGRANQLITAAVIKKIRNLKAWKLLGIDPLERQKLINRAAQKRYRRTHREVWTK